MKKISLDSLLLSKNAVDRWHKVVANSGNVIGALDPAEIPDEEAEVLSTGELRIFVSLPGDRPDVELVIPANEWSFSQ